MTKWPNDCTYISSSTLTFYCYRHFEPHIIMAAPVFYTICPSVEACRWCPFLRACGWSELCIGLHKTDTASDCSLIKWHCIGWTKTTTTNLCTKFAINFVFCCPAYTTSGINNYKTETAVLLLEMRCAARFSPVRPSPLSIADQWKTILLLKVWNFLLNSK